MTDHVLQPADIPEQFRPIVSELIKARTAVQADELTRLRAELRDAEQRGYARAIANLRDDDRYRDWWSSSNCQPTGPVRKHLADYLETVGRPDPIDPEALARRTAEVGEANGWAR